jgi:hypothetical protein
MSADTVRERSEAIAADQGQLRRRYGQFLGEESSLFGGEDHDEHEAKGGKMDVLHQFGHAHDEAENATLYDEGTKKVLRRALTAMWDAENALRAITPKTALAPEHKALAAIKELQQADRIYLHKTAFVPPPIKEDIRMTGDVVGAASYAREQGAAGRSHAGAAARTGGGAAGEGPLPALWTRTAHDWVRERLKDDEQRLAAQRAIQDVARRLPALPSGAARLAARPACTGAGAAAGATGRRRRSRAPGAKERMNDHRHRPHRRGQRAALPVAPALARRLLLAWRPRRWRCLPSEL